MNGKFNVKKCKNHLVGHTIMLSWEMASKNIRWILYFDNEYFKKFYRSIFKF